LVTDNEGGTKAEGVSEQGVEENIWIKEELNDLYTSPNIVRVIKSRRMRWAGYVARMEEGRGVHKVLVRKPEVKETTGETKT
jgi:hypothetical protein